MEISNPQSLSESESFQKLAQAYEKVTAEYEGKSEVREAAYANEQIRIEMLQKEYEERQKQADWINWIVAGVCIAGSIAVIACTGGAATPLVVAGVSGASGFIMSGTQSATSQYVQTGDWSKTDWLSVGKEAIIGGAEGFVTGYIGAGAGSVLTNALGKTAAMAPLLNSTSTVTRVASHAVIGSISQIGAGVATRFAGSMLTNGFDVEKSAKEAFNLQNILMDGAIGGVFGGVQGGLTKPQAFTSSQVQQVKGVGEGISVDNKSGKYSTQISPEIEKKILEGQQKSPFKNEVIGGHSSQINNNDSLFVVEELSVNADGTRNIKFIKDLQDGNISKIKKVLFFQIHGMTQRLLTA